jgi:TPR repeat protein
MRYFLLLAALLSLLVSGLALAEGAPPAIAQVDAEIGKKAQWRKEADMCPAALLPRRVSTDYLSGDSCQLNPGLCLLKCEAGNGGSCYWLAYAVQQGGGEAATAEALFQRACKLGVVSGCTNRAAAMSAGAPQDASVQHCAVETFKKTCAHNEPWGCTMYALHLTRGIGVKTNLDLALKVLGRSCRYGKEDPACANAMTLRQEILRKKQAAGK